MHLCKNLVIETAQRIERNKHRGVDKVCQAIFNRSQFAFLIHSLSLKLAEKLQTNLQIS